MGHFREYGSCYVIGFTLLFELLHQPDIEYMRYKRKQAQTSRNAGGQQSHRSSQRCCEIVVKALQSPERKGLWLKRAPFPGVQPCGNKLVLYMSLTQRHQICAASQHHSYFSSSLDCMPNSLAILLQWLCVVARLGINF